MKRPTGISPRLSQLVTYLFTIAGIALTFVSTLSAQDRLFAIVPTQTAGSVVPRHSLIELDTRPESLGRVIRSLPISGASNDDVVSVGAGRYLVWSGSGAVQAMDTATGATSALHMPSVRRILAGDPGSLRVFLDAVSSVVILNSGAVWPRAVLLPSGRQVGGGAYVKSVNRLFVVATSRPPSGVGPSLIDLYVVNADTGVVERSASLGTLPLFDFQVMSVAVDRPATRLFVQTRSVVDAYSLDADGGTTFQRRFHRGSLFDLDEQVLRTPIKIDEDRRRVTWIAGEPRSGTTYTPGVGAVDLDSLTLLGTIIDHSLDGYIQDFDTDPTHAEPSRYAPLRHVQAPRSPAYLFTSVYFRDCLAAQLTVLSPDTGALIRRADVLQEWGQTFPGACRAQLVLQAQPAAPTLTAHVQGARVTLSWSAVDDATHYDIEAGSAPGLANLLASPGHAGTSLTVESVPSGTYYVRVRAINWVGRSLPSEEVRVVVP